MRGRRAEEFSAAPESERACGFARRLDHRATGIGIVPFIKVSKKGSEAPASRKMPPAGKSFGPPRHQRGAGFRSLIYGYRATTIWSHAENFFQPFDFGRYSSVTYRGKSNAHAGWQQAR